MKSLVEKWFVNVSMQPYSNGNVIGETDVDVKISFVNSKDYLKDFSYCYRLIGVDLKNFDWSQISFRSYLGEMNVGYFLKDTWKKKKGADWYSKEDRWYR